MARVTATEVQAILEDTVAEATIEAFISGATVMLDEVFEDETSIGDELLKEIERWLTAHMIASTVARMAKKEGAGGASIEYTGVFKENLSSTPYGQQVLTLDTTGKLAALSGQKAAKLYTIGHSGGDDEWV